MNKNRASLPSPPSALDPRTLGRPVHLLPRFAEPLRRELAESLRTHLNLRYGASFELGEVAMAPLVAHADSGRWTICSGPGGRIAFALDRSLLLCVLDYRYGAGSDEPHDESAPETATEGRLKAALAGHFAQRVARRVLAHGGGPGLVDGDGDADALARIDATASGMPEAGAWLISAELAEVSRGIRGELRLALDNAWLNRVLRAVGPAANRLRLPPEAGDSFASRLRLPIVARLLKKEMPLGDLLDAQVGDVIPIRLEPATVLVGDSPLFRAAVTEHEGKLCLTSFEDLE